MLATYGEHDGYPIITRKDGRRLWSTEGPAGCEAAAAFLETQDLKLWPLEYDDRADILPVGPDFGIYFKRMAPAFQRCNNQQKRCSYGRDRVALAGTTTS